MTAEQLKLLKAAADVIEDYIETIEKNIEMAQMNYGKALLKDIRKEIDRYRGKNPDEVIIDERV